jgi:predicted nucleic acid-binding protein
MVIYPDTSFLVPIYVEEGESPRLDRYLAAATSPLCFTPFHRLELRTALRARVFRRELSFDQLRAALRDSEQDLLNGTLQHTPLAWPEVLREAERIGEEHLARTGVRSGDLLHVASAVALGAREFLTFDQRQGKLARLAGLKVKH